MENGNVFKKVRQDAGYSWSLGNWRSAPFPYLEERPWTPRVIGGRPCFVACDTADLDAEGAFGRACWCVVWGERAGPWFDDVGRLEAFRDRPLYIARCDGPAGPLYHAVWDEAISQGYNHQISLVLGPDGVAALPLRARAGGPAEPLNWRPLAQVRS